MKVIVKNSYLVKPAEPTWTGCMTLSEFDQTGLLSHVPTIYFYKPYPPTQERIIETLRGSLSRALVHFFPFAGRLRWLDGARVALDCNCQGVQLVEAEAEAVIDDLGDFTPCPDFNYLIPQINYLSTPIEEIPLLCVQLTKFKCGGITLGYNVSHEVVDGLSAFHFTSEWARLTRGEALAITPYLDRKHLQAGEPVPESLTRPLLNVQFDTLPVLIGGPRDDHVEHRVTTVALLKLSKSHVDKLRTEANAATFNHDQKFSRPHTRYESIAAHIWRCACKARRHVPEQPTALGISVDVRKRVQPPLPPNYFGNAILDVIARSHSGDIVSQPLGYAAQRIREAIDKVTSEYVHATIDYLKTVKDLSRMEDVRGLRTNEWHGNPNLGVVSWMTLPLDGMDFGWGKEVFMAPGPHDDDGDSLILPGCDGDGSLVVAMCLQVWCMEDFKKFFYEGFPSDDRESGN